MDNMAHSQRAILIVGVFMLVASAYMTWIVQLQSVRAHDAQNANKIQCILHRDNPDVHRLCVDHGYDGK